MKGVLMSLPALPHPWRGIRPFERHSLVLLVAGVVYVFVGMGYMFTETTPARDKALQIALDWWSFDVWGSIFVFAGVLTIISSRWPPVSHTWGYMVLTGLSTGWGCFYATGAIFGDAPASNYYGFLTWSLLGFLWWAISGLTNPTVVVVEIPEAPVEEV